MTVSNTKKTERRTLAKQVQEILAPKVQETTREDIPELGSFIRVAAWTGIVRDIFISAVSGRVILQIYFAKNVLNSRDRRRITWTRSPISWNHPVWRNSSRRSNVMRR